MRTFQPVPNIKVDGDEYTAGFLGLHWFPTAGPSANQQHYENDVLGALDRLMKTMSGWAVLNDIYYAPSKTMIIQPFHPTAKDPVNAYASPVDWNAATLKDTTVLNSDGSQPKPSERRTGTGQGSDTVISFSSSVFGGVAAPGSNPGATPDEILLHEMAHGLRQMMGRSVREAVTGNPGMDNYEEFVAILIANLYRSEIGGPNLRQDHHGFTPLSGPTANPATFKSTYSRYLNYMDIETPRLCQNLRQVRCAFNPLV
jgi:hypothetical protein